MKTLDKYILKSFLKPFFATFLIILFVLVMQFLWLAFDNFAGKGISIWFILKFLWYVMLIVTPQAIPIGVLLSSIMTLGSLSENYEFAAAKSAGVSLQRIVRPLAVLVLFLSVINFGFYNYVYPYAMLKQINLKMNAKKKQPALALVPGSFNTEIPNYHIKFDEKYGEEKNLLKNVIIYDLSSRKGNNKIISAKEGELVSKEGSRYMTLILKNGHFFEHHISNTSTYKERKKMPASYAEFDEYTINIDISSFSDDGLEDLKYTKNFNMLSLAQLKDTMPDLKQNFDEYIESRARNLFLNVDAKNLYQHADSVVKKELSTDILDNFELKSKVSILDTSVSKIERSLDNIKSNKDTFKHKRKIVNLYDIEFYNRVALSLSCLLLFFVGAPLGSIIRKGGMGLPMILAILIYVTYHFSNTFGRNLAEESSLTAIAGSWLAVTIMTPLAIILTVRAAQDKGFDGFVSNFIYFFSLGKNHDIHDISKDSKKEDLLNFYFNQYKLVSNISLIFNILICILSFINYSIFKIAILIIFFIFYLVNVIHSINYYDKIHKLLNQKIKTYPLYLLVTGASFLYFTLYYFSRRDLKYKISQN